MANTVIALKRSDIPFAVPTNLANGELAINYADGKLFYKNTTGDIVEISGGAGGLGGNYFGTVNANGTFLISDTSGDVLTVKQGENIIITGDAITDSFTITANLSPAYTLGNAAFDKANVVSSDLSNTAVVANSYAGSMANASNAYAASVGAAGNAYTSYVHNLANAAFDRANLSNDVLLVDTVWATANAAFERANLSNDVLLVDTVWVTTNAAYDMANAANLLAFNTGIGANAWVNTVASAVNSYSESIGAAANAWANSVAASGNAWTNTIAVAANNWANTKLSNTSGVTFDGNLTISSDLTIGNNLYSINSAFFDTTTSIPAVAKGQIVWNGNEETFDMGMANGSILQVGQELYYRVKNQSGSTITEGTVVMSAGTLGASGRILVTPAVSDGSFPSKYLMGVATGTMLNGEDGYVTAFGKVHGIDTSMWSEGDILYANVSVAGAFQNTAPSAPNTKTTVAIVINKHAVNGTIFVRPTYGSKINEDEMVELDGLTNGDVLQYVSANGRFENKNTLVNVYNLANAAFDRANLSNDVLLVDTVWATANAAFDRANLSNDVLLVDTVWASTNAAYNLANAAFDYANTLISGGAVVTVSNTAPVGPVEGNLWWNEDLGKMFIFYVDEDSSQWVEVNPSGGVGGGGGGGDSGPAFAKANAAYNLANSALPNTTATLSGNLTVTNSVTLGTSQVKGFSYTTAAISSVFLDSFPKTEWRSAIYNITMTSGTDYHTTQISVIHDDVDAYMTEYGTLITANNLGTFSVSISSANVRLSILPTFAVTVVKVVRTTNK